MSLPVRVGILGGGQLARMLILKGHEMGLQMHVLSSSSEDPAAQVTGYHHVGDPNDAADVRNFLRVVDLVTFESEFLEAESLAKLSTETKCPIRPHPDVIARIQDRLEQKSLLLDHHLPTAPFYSVKTLYEAKRALHALNGKMVLKKRRFGYDGYGTFVIKNAAELDRQAQTIENDPNGFIAESFISFRRELALMIARRKGGETTSKRGQKKSALRRDSKATLHLPFVETYQEDSRCLWVKGPLRLPRETKLIRNLEQMMEAMDYEGILGVELFETKQGLMINELAPRVHNSGHYSLDALEEDQFTLHLKAILGLPFNRVRPLAPGFAMLNLLGSSERECQWRLPADVHLHWYGKSKNRKGRKMGHLNGLGTTPQQALKQLMVARKQFDV